MTHYGDALTPGTRLEEFEIERTLGAGGFGVTYRAWDRSLDRSVAIKEYLPRDFGSRRSDGSIGPRSVADVKDYRWGLDRFLAEARILANLEHPNIVRVYRIIPAVGGTAYMVMELVEGRSLKEELTAEGKLPEKRVRDILTALIAGLERVHTAQLLHRDIKPANVMLREKDGAPVLIDFGAARQVTGQQSRSVNAVLTPGYAAIELYETYGNQGPWTDIYALGALAYASLTGEVPDDATMRVRKGRDRLRPVAVAAEQPVSRGLAAAVQAALQVEESDRPQNLKNWRVLLDVPDPEEESAPTGEESSVEEASQTSPAVATQGLFRYEEPRSRSTHRRWLYGAAAGTVGAALLAALLAGGSGVGVGVPERGSGGGVGGGVPEVVGGGVPEVVGGGVPEVVGGGVPEVVGGGVPEVVGGGGVPEVVGGGVVGGGVPEVVGGGVPEVVGGGVVGGGVPEVVGGGVPEVVGGGVPEVVGGGVPEVVGGGVPEVVGGGVPEVVGGGVPEVVGGGVPEVVGGGVPEVVGGGVPEVVGGGVPEVVGGGVPEVVGGGVPEVVGGGAGGTTGGDPPDDVARVPGTVFRSCTDCPWMVVVPSGAFQMGSTEGQTDELPVHEVRVSTFALGRYEVTRREYGAFVSDTRHAAAGCNVVDEQGDLDWDSDASWLNPRFRQEDDHPVVCVGWEDARAYVQWLGGRTDERYRLPSEAEWEYAARAETVTSRYWDTGTGNQCSNANGGDRTLLQRLDDWPLPVARCTDGGVHTTQVGAYGPNSFKLYDMLGNVWEWMADCWHADYQGAPPDGSTWRSGNCDGRVWRGGSWETAPIGLRSANRFRNDDGRANNVTGFRVAREFRRR